MHQEPFRVGQVCGIDFGSTNYRVAVWEDQGAGDPTRVSLLWMQAKGSKTADGLTLFQYFSAFLDGF